MNPPLFGAVWLWREVTMKFWLHCKVSDATAEVLNDIINGRSLIYKGSFGTYVETPHYPKERSVLEHVQFKMIYKS